MSVTNWELPAIKRCDIDIRGIHLIGADKAKKEDFSRNIFSGVHFFLDDYKLERYYRSPQNYVKRLAQYRYVLTPDYSLLTNMPLAIQLYNTYKNRCCGATWQYYGLSVIPTVNWSTEESFDFCFNGLEPGTNVAISTLGCLKTKKLFMRGYDEMKKRLAPKQILCYGKNFPEMDGEVIQIDYLKTTGRLK